jgi:hypothetical protein
MSIFVPLVLVVMPMSIGLGALLFVIAVMGAFAFAAIYASGPHADGRSVRAIAALYAAARMNQAPSDAASHRSRVACVAQLYAAVKQDYSRHVAPRRDAVSTFVTGGLDPVADGAAQAP